LRAVKQSVRTAGQGTYWFKMRPARRSHPLNSDRNRPYSVFENRSTLQMVSSKI
jgi:hypothetical protein